MNTKVLVGEDSEMSFKVRIGREDRKDECFLEMNTHFFPVDGKDLNEGKTLRKDWIISKS